MKNPFSRPPDALETRYRKGSSDQTRKNSRKRGVSSLISTCFAENPRVRHSWNQIHPIKREWPAAGHKKDARFEKRFTCACESPSSPSGQSALDADFDGNDADLVFYGSRIKCRSMRIMRHATLRTDSCGAFIRPDKGAQHRFVHCVRNCALPISHRCLRPVRGVDRGRDLFVLETVCALRFVL